MKLVPYIIIVLLMTAVTRATEARAAEEKPLEDVQFKPEILATERAYDAKTGRIAYSLPEACLVRIQIGYGKGGPLLINLLDWEPREAGANAEQWEFKDKTGTIFFGPRDDYKVILSTYPLKPEDQKMYRSTAKGFRKAPEFTVTFPESEVKDGVVQFGHMDPIRVTISDKDSQWLAETKYEVALFIDYVFLAEDEEGINPYTYPLKTTGLSEGLHTISVNVVGYEGEVGTKSVLVNIMKL